MAKYTHSVETNNGNIEAIIYVDGNRVIVQPMHPFATEPWATEAEAKAWAIQHCDELETAYIQSVENQRLEEERKEAAHQANLASIETAKALQSLVAHLANPSA